MRHGYPIFLDLSQRLVVIVGGGAVASRKAAGLLAGGAGRIRAVAPKFVRDFPEAVQKITQAFAPEHLDGAALVFAATDSPQTNEAVVAEARSRGILVGRADVDDDDPADFVTPAVLRSGAITVAISAGAPALAAAVRDSLAGSVTNDWVNLADALRQIRPRIKSADLPAPRRREIFRALATAEAAAAAAGGPHALWDWARGRFHELGQW
ncbi:MAG: NAD(P)-dependent oxidoreductase [Tepidisphaeraceae bacterium]|jgi:siroheme synthase-like protein